MSDKQNPSDITRGVIRWLIRTLVFMIIIALTLFLPARDWRWTDGWVYLGIFVLIQIVNMLTLLASNPYLLIERADIQQGTKDWDRLLSVLVALFGPLSMWIIAGLDHRFGWPLGIQPWVGWIGQALVLSGGLLTVWAMIANPYFSGTVRIQDEHDHRVADGGPYRIVRHPGYAGATLYDLATPMALVSLWTFIPAGITVVFIVIRTLLEDRTLLAELNGYQEYALRIRYRLLPGIW